MKTMTEAATKELGARILAEQQAARTRLLALDGTRRSSVRETEGDNTPIADPLEAAQETLAEIEREGSREMLIRRLKKLYRAAEKVREGSYGACDECGEDIPLGRLQAVPEAVLCRSCAEEAERLAARDARGARARIWGDDVLAVAA